MRYHNAFYLFFCKRFPSSVLFTFYILFFYFFFIFILSPPIKLPSSTNSRVVALFSSSFSSSFCQPVLLYFFCLFSVLCFCRPFCHNFFFVFPIPFILLTIFSRSVLLFFNCPNFVNIFSFSNLNNPAFSTNSALLEFNLSTTSFLDSSRKPRLLLGLLNH